MQTAPATSPADALTALREAAKRPLEARAAAPPLSLTTVERIGKVDAGKALTLDDFPKKPLLLIFGSFSSPTMRQHVPALNELRKTRGQKASFLVVYTREAHAVGEWEVERNRDEDLRLDQPATLDARVRNAKGLRDGLKLTLDLAVDSMDDTTTLAYHAFSNGAVLLKADRTVYAALRWTEPHALERLIDELDKAKN